MLVEVVVFELLVIWCVLVVGMIEIGVVDKDVDGMVKLLAEGFKTDITGEELVVVVEVEHGVLPSVPVKSGYNRVCVVDVVTAAWLLDVGSRGTRDAAVVVEGTSGTEEVTGGGGGRYTSAGVFTFSIVSERD